MRDDSEGIGQFRHGEIPELLRRSLGEAIAIETVLAGGLWRTHADPNELESAILNLAINARDAMPEGGRLTIETSNIYLDERYAARDAEVAAGQYVVVAITDTGTGMSEDVLARAFEPFFTSKEVGQGTGLGLSQLYGFVKQSGGDVKIYSEPGQGTTVKVYLPRLLADEDDSEPSDRLEAASADGRTQTILVVEDDDDVRAHSVEILQELGYRVLEASDAQAALDIIGRQRDVALLFTDVGLPGGMNGRQLAEEAVRRCPGLQVLYTTGYAQNAILHDGRLDAGVELITKPFSYPSLAAKLRDLLNADGRAPRVLVVEDATLVRMAAVDALANLGFRVEEAASAGEAIAKVRVLAGRIDAAIIDVELPDRKGDGLAAELRAMSARLPIVIARGYPQQVVAARFEGYSMVGFVAKPYGREALESALRELGVEPPAA